MNVLGSGSASSRRLIVTTLFAAMIGVTATAQAQQAPAPAPAAPAAQAEPADPFKFTSDAALVLWTVKADKTADFESVWSELLKKAAASDKPDVKAVAETLKMFKADLPASPQGVTYVFSMDPAKAPTYSPTVLMYSSGLYERAEAETLYKKLADTIAGINPVPLKKVQ
ncbi:MAG: hypothetical protein ABI634_02075 [Acidobacteriota bacterium]